MGKCLLGFDQIEIVQKKSDSHHSDGDWMVVTWFVADKVVRTDKIPLWNTTGSMILESGEQIVPFASEVDCNDGDFVSAQFLIVNLGSSDPSDQIDAIGKIAENVSQEIAKVYLQIAEKYVELEVPGGEFFANGIETLAPVIVQSVGAAFEDIIIPLIKDIINEIDAFLGHPNCNGEVLHDIVLFKPREPAVDMNIEKTYSGPSKSHCGSPITRVNLTMHRELSVPPVFANTPPPEVDLVPSTSDGNWLGAWAEDTNTPNPRIVVNISESKAASGLYAVDIKEIIDSRFNIVFRGGADPISPHLIGIFPYLNTPVFGSLRAWTSHPLQPSGAWVYKLAPTTQASKASSGKTQTKVRAGNATTIDLTKTVASTQTDSFQFVFKLAWQKTQIMSVPTASPIKLGGGSFSPGLPSSESVTAIRIPTQGVTLCAYELISAGKIIGFAVRYIREQSLTFTRADVMLVKWSPVG